MLSDVELRRVALRLKRRHLRSHLDIWRTTWASLEAVRRSRQKRARLLRLARKHGLQLCLAKLRQPGFSIEHSHRSRYFYYEHECTREYLLGLQDKLIECGLLWKELRTESLDPRIANLRELLEDTEIIREHPLEVRWTLEGVELESVWIGDMEITLNLEEFRIKVFNHSADTEIRGGYQHPHVSSDGEICWNGHDEEAWAYHRSGDFLALRDLIENLLQTYNSRSPYIHLEDWENGLGECCSDCGERYPGDDMAYVGYLSDVLCPECRSYCERCDQYVHYQDYERNLDQNWEMCKWCAGEYTSACEECGERFLLEDLHSVKISMEDEIYEIQLCEACYEEHLRKEEEDHANLDDPPSLLAPAVALPSHQE